jgi:molybdopterin biosynthesis enzyme
MANSCVIGNLNHKIAVMPFSSESLELAISILAALGLAFIRVIRRPTVAILNTGDELIHAWDPSAEVSVLLPASWALFSCGAFSARGKPLG